MSDQKFMSAFGKTSRDYQSKLEQPFVSYSPSSFFEVFTVSVLSVSYKVLFYNSVATLISQFTSEFLGNTVLI